MAMAVWPNGSRSEVSTARTPEQHQPMSLRESKALGDPHDDRDRQQPVEHLEDDRAGGVEQERTRQRCVEHIPIQCVQGEGDTAGKQLENDGHHAEASTDREWIDEADRLLIRASQAAGNPVREARKTPSPPRSPKIGSRPGRTCPCGVVLEARAHELDEQAGHRQQRDAGDPRQEDARCRGLLPSALPRVPAEIAASVVM